MFSDHKWHPRGIVGTASKTRAGLSRTWQGSHPLVCSGTTSAPPLALPCSLLLSGQTTVTTVCGELAQGPGLAEV